MFCGKINKKITRSVKTPFHKYTEVLGSYSWAPGKVLKRLYYVCYCRISKKFGAAHLRQIVLRNSLLTWYLFALVTRRPYCPGRPKKLWFTTPSLAPMVSTVRLGVVKQSFFSLPGQYGRRVTRANDDLWCSSRISHWP